MDASGRPTVGDVIANPAEPPVGTVLECRDDMGTFRLYRDDRGWYQDGSPRRVAWRVVVELWLPARVVKLPVEEGP